MKILKLVCIKIFLVIMITSCQKQNIDEIIPKEPEYEIDTIDVNPMISQLKSLTSESIFLSCLELPYPVDFVKASGNVIRINSDAELDAAMMLSDSIVDFSYPFTVFNGSSTIQISNIQDLSLAIQECSTTPTQCTDLEAHVLLFFNSLNIFTLNRYVYDITYPVRLIVEGTQVVVNNPDEYLPAVSIGGSPNKLLKTDIVYPVTITQFGRKIVLNNDNDVCRFYQTLSEPCQNKPTHIQFFFNEGPGTRVKCTYFIKYPVNITLNGVTLNIPTREDYLNLLNTSPSAYNNISLVYPLSVIKLYGPPLNFTADADICQYLNNCQ